MTDQNDEQKTAQLIAEIKEMSILLTAVKKEIGTVIFDQDDMTHRILLAMASGGHALLVGNPGLAKTEMVKRLGETMGLQSGRVQFTPDLMPSDIVGIEVADQDETGKRSFRFVPGPVFTQLLLADEINRASPRTQSAMLQSMQEKTVTVGKFTYPLPKGFTVLATQNPIEQEGTYNLPEAQQDRFRIWVDVTYPTEETDYKIAKAATATSVYKTFEQLNGGKKAPGDFNFDEEDSLTGAFNANAKLRQIMTREQVLRMPQIVDQMPAGEELLRAVARVVNAARPHTDIATTAVKEHLEWGPGPRADQALVLCAKANALMAGRLAPSKDDLREILEPVMKLRMGYKWNAQNDATKKAAVINSLKAVI